MQSIKIRGSLTRGRGMREQQRTVQLLSIPACNQVNHTKQQVSGGVCYDESEQHKEVSNSCTNKDYKDCHAIHSSSRSILSNEKLD